MKPKSHIPLPIEYATKPRDGVRLLIVCLVIGLLTVAVLAEWLLS